MAGPSTFRFLFQERALSASGDWNRADWPKLWLYNLHYFDDLNADGAEVRIEWHRELLARWVAENPPPTGNGWEPYPISLRMVNWVKWSWAGNALPPMALESLAMQARWLARRIEWHLMGNHLLANAKALVFVGTYFEGPEADSWRAQGLAILARELPEQILSDGGHFERSPMYHAIVLEDLLDLVQLGTSTDIGDAKIIRQWKERAVGMLRWLAAMTHPDGEIAFFNDAAMGIAPNLTALWSYAAELGIGVPEVAPLPLTRLSETGYVRLENDSAVVIADGAPVGPDYLPGHAHADTLSFELSLFGERLVVNSGTSEYAAGPVRMRQRGTSAHNTVILDGCDSSEVWSAFRVARRARPFDLEAHVKDGHLELTCAHDGYTRLPGRPIHRRRWRLGARELEIIDIIEGRFREAVAFFHFHPAVRVEGNGHQGTLVLGSGRVANWNAVGGECRLEPATWHPEFGASCPSRRLALAFAGDQVAMTFSWL